MQITKLKVKRYSRKRQIKGVDFGKERSAVKGIHPKRIGLIHPYNSFRGCISRRTAQTNGT